MIPSTVGVMLTLASLSGFGFAATELPLYYGWFVDEDDSTSFLSRSFKTLSDTLEAVPEFMDDVRRFTGHVYISDIVAHYTRENANEVLHCTAAYNGISPDYTPGAEEYSKKKEVQAALNAPSTLHSIGWILTSRTFGARVHLTEDQLRLWNQDDTQGNPSRSLKRKNRPEVTDGFIYRRLDPAAAFNETVVDQDPDILGSFKPTSGNGSRAHLTLGCAPGVSAVTTGYDLVDLIKLEQQGAAVANYVLPDSIAQGGGWLINYDNGQWVFYPKKQWLLDSTFLGYVSGSVRRDGSLTLLILSSVAALLAFYVLHR